MTSLKIALALLLLQLSMLCLAQKNTIAWSAGDALSWENFRVRAKAQGSTVAMTHAGFNSRYFFEQGVLRISSSAYFDPKRSWVAKESKGDKKLLKHEQIHFDITELFHRRLIKSFSEAKFSANPNKINKKYSSIVNKVNQELRAYQDLYDRETRHHMNREKQEAWNKKIAEELKSLEEYAKTELVFDLSK